MNNPELLSCARRAGDLLGQRAVTLEVIQSLNPYYAADPDEREPRVNDTQKARAVETLLALIATSSGEAAAAEVRAALDFRADVYEDGWAYLNGLDEPRWLSLADLTLIRAFEVRQSRPALADYMALADAEREFNLSESTLRKAAQEGRLPAEHLGRDWLVKRADVEAYLERTRR